MNGPALVYVSFSDGVRKEGKGSPSLNLLSTFPL